VRDPHGVLETIAAAVDERAGRTADDTRRAIADWRGAIPKHLAGRRKALTDKNLEREPAGDVSPIVPSEPVGDGEQPEGWSEQEGILVIVPRAAVTRPRCAQRLRTDLAGGAPIEVLPPRKGVRV
jgi:hypothetical protein